MIIKSSRNNSKFVYTKPVEEEKPTIVKEEVKPVINEINHKKKNKKTVPIVVEEPVMVEEKVEDDIDLSEWLKEDIEE